MGLKLAKVTGQSEEMISKGDYLLQSCLVLVALKKKIGNLI